MGKKSKGNKLAKMSEEERARYLQMRADQEEETRRRKMALISLYMKNKLKREEAFCRLNIAKINQEWRTMLRLVKIQDLRREILDAEQFFNEALKRKDQVVQRLLGDIESTEAMYGNMQHAHIENVQNIIDTYHNRVAFLQQTYEDEKQAILEDWALSHADSKEMHTQKQEALERVFYQLEDTTEKQIKENHERFLDCMEDLKSSTQLEVEETTAKGEAKLESLWQDYQKVLSDYVKHIEDFYAEYVDLKERDEESAIVKSNQSHEIEQLQLQVASLKLATEKAQSKQEADLKHIQDIKQQLSDRLDEVRKCVNKELTDDKKSFKTMSVEAHNVIETFKGHVAKSMTLVQLMEVCNKLQAEYEKTLKLPELTAKDGISKKAQSPISRDEPRTAGGLKIFDSFAPIPEMENFWNRVNNVGVDVAYLKREKRQLELENKQLKLQLKDYLINLNISNGSNSHVNDYLSKRPKSMTVNRVEQFKLQSKQVKSAGTVSRRGSYVPRCDITFSNTVRSQKLQKGRQLLAKIDVKINM